MQQLREKNTDKEEKSKELSKDTREQSTHKQKFKQIDMSKKVAENVKRANKREKYNEKIKKSKESQDTKRNFRNRTKKSDTRDEIKGNRSNIGQSKPFQSHKTGSLKLEHTELKTSRERPHTEKRRGSEFDHCKQKPKSEKKDLAEIKPCDQESKNRSIKSADVKKLSTQSTEKKHEAKIKKAEQNVNDITKKTTESHLSGQRPGTGKWRGFKVDGENRDVENIYTSERQPNDIHLEGGKVKKMSQIEGKKMCGKDNIENLLDKKVSVRSRSANIKKFVEKPNDEKVLKKKINKSSKELNGPKERNTEMKISEDMERYKRKFNIDSKKFKQRYGGGGIAKLDYSRKDSGEDKSFDQRATLRKHILDSTKDNEQRKADEESANFNCQIKTSAVNKDYDHIGTQIKKYRKESMDPKESDENHKETKKDTVKFDYQRKWSLEEKAIIHKEGDLRKYRTTSKTPRRRDVHKNKTKKDTENLDCRRESSANIQTFERSSGKVQKRSADTKQSDPRSNTKTKSSSIIMKKQEKISDKGQSVKEVKRTDQKNHNNAKKEKDVVASTKATYHKYAARSNNRGKKSVNGGKENNKMVLENETQMQKTETTVLQKKEMHALIKETFDKTPNVTTVGEHIELEGIAKQSIGGTKEVELGKGRPETRILSRLEIESMIKRKMQSSTSMSTNHFSNDSYLSTRKEIVPSSVSTTLNTHAKESQVTNSRDQKKECVASQKNNLISRSFNNDSITKKYVSAAAQAIEVLRAKSDFLKKGYENSLDSEIADINHNMSNSSNKLAFLKELCDDDGSVASSITNLSSNGSLTDVTTLDSLPTLSTW